MDELKAMALAYLKDSGLALADGATLKCKPTDLYFRSTEVQGDKVLISFGIELTVVPEHRQKAIK